MPQVPRKTSGWEEQNQASRPSVQSSSKYAQGPKPLRGHPPRAVHEQHGLKWQSPPRDCDLRCEQEGRGLREHTRFFGGSRPSSLQPRLSLLGFAHKMFRSRMLLWAKGNKLSGGCGPICSDETLPNPDLPSVSFQGIFVVKELFTPLVKSVHHAESSA